MSTVFQEHFSALFAFNRFLFEPLHFGLKLLAPMDSIGMLIPFFLPADPYCLESRFVPWNFGNVFFFYFFGKMEEESSGGCTGLKVKEQKSSVINLNTSPEERVY